MLASSGPAQITVPFTGLPIPQSVAVDPAGDVFAAGCSQDLELPADGSRYGKQRSLPLTGECATGLAFDRSGDLYVVDDWKGEVYELPARRGGFGPQRTLPFTGLANPESVAVDRAGNVYVTNWAIGDVLELQAVRGGFGRQRTLPFTGLVDAAGVAVNQDGNVFVTDTGNGPTRTGPGQVLELIQSGRQAGQQRALPFTGLSRPWGLAIDPAGDVFITDRLDRSAMELPARPGGYGPQRALPFTGLGDPLGMAVSCNGSVFVADDRNGDVVELASGLP